MRYFYLAVGIIRNPSKALDYIIQERPIKIGILIWLFGWILNHVDILLLMHKTESLGLGYSLTVLARGLIQPATIIATVGVFITPFLEDFCAEKFFKAKSNYIGLLACNLFIVVIGILCTCLEILLTFSPAIDFRIYSWLVFAPWLLVLYIMAIRKVYAISTGRAFIVLLCAGIVVSLLYAVVAKISI